jgi:hypothetical protein
MSIGSKHKHYDFHVTDFIDKTVLFVDAAAPLSGTVTRELLGFSCAFLYAACSL